MKWIIKLSKCILSAVDIRLGEKIGKLENLIVIIKKQEK